MAMSLASVCDLAVHHRTAEISVVVIINKRPWLLLIIREELCSSAYRFIYQPLVRLLYRSREVLTLDPWILLLVTRDSAPPNLSNTSRSKSQKVPILGFGANLKYDGD